MELWDLYTYDRQKTEYAMLRGGDQMAWIGAMNNIQASAREIVYIDIIYT